MALYFQKKVLRTVHQAFYHIPEQTQNPLRSSLDLSASSQWHVYMEPHSSPAVQALHSSLSPLQWLWVGCCTSMALDQHQRRSHLISNNGSWQLQERREHEVFVLILVLIFINNFWQCVCRVDNSLTNVMKLPLILVLLMETNYLHNWPAYQKNSGQKLCCQITADQWCNMLSD